MNKANNIPTYNISYLYVVLRWRMVTLFLEIVEGLKDKKYITFFIMS